ncbi:MAG: hypothetical protein AAF224_04710 [Pseudomonadota bacterium]
MASFLRRNPLTEKRHTRSRNNAYAPVGNTYFGIGVDGWRG